jgi:hypothetical protein
VRRRLHCIGLLSSIALIGNYRLKDVRRSFMRIEVSAELRLAKTGPLPVEEVRYADNL